jgi:hypothetical protein
MSQRVNADWKNIVVGVVDVLKDIGKRETTGMGKNSPAHIATIDG